MFIETKGLIALTITVPYSEPLFIKFCIIFSKKDMKGNETYFVTVNLFIIKWKKLVNQNIDLYTYDVIAIARLASVGHNQQLPE